MSQVRMLLRRLIPRNSGIALVCELPAVSNIYEEGYFVRRNMSMNSTRKRRPPRVPDSKAEIEATPLVAEILGDFSDDQEFKSLKTDHLNEDLENIKRLMVEAKSETRFVRMKNVKNFLEVPEQYAESTEKTNISNYEVYLRDLQGLSTSTTQHSMDRFGEVVELVGTPDPKVPMSDTPCHGCGAILHCQDPGVPGYMPSEKFMMLSSERLKSWACQRCLLLKRYKLALNVAVKPKQYVDIIRKIRHKQGLVLVVVDLSDLPNSLYSELPSIIGEQRDVYIVGNKADILPKDSEGYLAKTMRCLKFYLSRFGLTQAFNIRHLTLVSAKTGYGIEDLVTKLLDDWGRSGDVFVVGCTNVGKSTLFNALLSSDYCRSASRDFISRATTSVWPGTTLNVLKFPIINPKPSKLFKRAERLKKDKAWQVEAEKLRKSKLTSKKDYKYATLMGHIGQTFLSPKATALRDEEHTGQDVPSYTLNTQSEELEMSIDIKKVEMKEKIKKLQVHFDDMAREKSLWCYDTPGVINPTQIINLLTQEELVVMLSERLMVPRTYRLRPTQTLFISGLARIDYEKGDRQILITAFCNFTLPVVVVNKREVDRFYRNNVGTRRLQVPIGDSNRLDKLPSLVGKAFSLIGKGKEKSAVDITLSSLGWVAVSPLSGDKVTVRAYTPGGQGIHVRSPLLPCAVSLRGKYTKHGRFEIGMPLA